MNEERALRLAILSAQTQKNMEMGWAESRGRKEGEKKGKEEARTEFIRSMASKGYTPEIISDALSIDLEDVKKALK